MELKNNFSGHLNAGKHNIINGARMQKTALIVSPSRHVITVYFLFVVRIASDESC